MVTLTLANYVCPLVTYIVNLRASIVVEGGFQGMISHIKREGRSSKTRIIVHDRYSGKLVEEKIPDYIKVAMKMMYTTSSGRKGIQIYHIWQ